jgi:hypothetical protein
MSAESAILLSAALAGFLTWVFATNGGTEQASDLSPKLIASVAIFGVTAAAPRKISSMVQRAIRRSLAGDPTRSAPSLDRRCARPRVRAEMVMSLFGVRL